MLLTTQGQLEARLQERGGQFMVGNSFTWADLHLFFFCSEDFLDSKVLNSTQKTLTNLGFTIQVVTGYPLIANLVGRVGAH